MSLSTVATSRDGTTEEDYENFGLGRTSYAEAEVEDLQLTKRQWHYGHDLTGKAEIEVDGEELEYQVLVEDENGTPEAHFYERPSGYADVDAEEPVESVEIEEFGIENLEDSINQALEQEHHEL